MIVSDTFIWLHLPKTGGTSTAQLFRNLNLPGIRIDSDHEDSKHESIETRLNGLQPNRSLVSIITTRRLSNWLLSDWHHKTLKMGLSLPFEPVKSGLFYSLRLGGTWVAADYWIQYFRAKDCDRVVRLEHLEEDTNRLVLPLLPTKLKALKFPQKNYNHYNRSIEKFFGNGDISTIYQNNPCWAAWEKDIYGDLATINPMKRLISNFK